MDNAELKATIDARGVLCPEPVLRARQALTKLESGDAIALLATDAHAELDIEVFCASAGHQLLDSNCESGVWRFIIAKGG